MADLAYVAENIRQADRDECFAAAGVGPEAALTMSALGAKECLAMLTPDNEVAGICGISPGITPGDRTVWMLGTPLIEQHARLFLRESRTWFDAKCSKHRLWNYVDERNTKHVRWLRWLGVTFLGHKTSPFTGTKLLYFTKDETQCA